MLSFTDSSAIAPDAERLRRSAEESGYLFFRGLVAPAAVGALRDQVVPRCEKHGWLARGGAPDPVAFLAEVLSLPAFVALGDDPAILAVLSRIFQGPVATRCGDVCRVVSPESPESATPPHQDQFYVRGAANLWTVWVPLGDCPRTLGGLRFSPVPIGPVSWRTAVARAIRPLDRSRTRGGRRRIIARVTSSCSGA